MVHKISPGLSITYSSLAEIKVVAKQIIDFAGDDKVWIFDGEMGAGKTTLIKAICDQLGVEDVVNSPTYAIVNEYNNDEGETLYHFDFYRLDDQEEAMEIGATEYFYSGDYCFIEWPSKVSDLLPDELLKIDISITEDNSRLIEVTRYE
ncbi:tRNA (adenosine(37)-N6)-threonylcarbamoyltransferase complex ATPase subunit type 1 TsaE [Fulvivirga maritima]|uniref:tRNA (adenosine(37)-N6)-threonylcarbamoyltransferase complex ATPase subunit type 1 TsaE n=1 Tax=Fulvivirga maritima TaxID=2904247 RepID=UPI001F028928|nr:tRNA (adenosine(37)-N6)-threonylcarbamoyltransferase complex ATPase subunit type 1 TsaE [Fulvivirga maritima]UII27248.1 tRNA (adenosine(37)-N6)-threonylcarbamoyltransferase complex ATPase subunit type 1 TsaE [Fulvivirga maritima]